MTPTWVTWVPLTLAALGLLCGLVAVRVLLSGLGRIRDGLRTAAWQRLDARRAALDHAVLEQTSLVALQGDYADLRSADRQSRARLEVLGRMHLDLFQAGWDLLDGADRSTKGSGTAQARTRADRWKSYMRDVYDGSDVVRDVLERTAHHYSPDLVADLVSPPEGVTEAANR